jgi:hypothetical protein
MIKLLIFEQRMLFFGHYVHKFISLLLAFGHNFVQSDLILQSLSRDFEHFSCL